MTTRLDSLELEDILKVKGKTNVLDTLTIDTSSGTNALLSLIGDEGNVGSILSILPEYIVHFSLE